MAYFSLACPKCRINREGTIVSKFHHHLQLPLRLDAKSEREVVLYLCINVQQGMLLIIEHIFRVFHYPHSHADWVGWMFLPKLLRSLSTNVPHINRQQECIAGDNTIGKGQLSHFLCVLLHDLSW